MPEKGSCKVAPSLGGFLTMERESIVEERSGETLK